jgi:hypothetical protein
MIQKRVIWTVASLLAHHGKTFPMTGYAQSVVWVKRILVGKSEVV